jgi:hypothetical protein
MDLLGSFRHIQIRNATLKEPLMPSPSKRTATIKSLKAEFSAIHAKGEQSTTEDVIRAFAIRAELARLGVSTASGVTWIRNEKLTTI